MIKQKKRYSISEVARMFGVSSESLRNYERRGLIAPARTETGYRTYTLPEIYQLSRICRLRNSGYSFQEIELLSTAEYPQALALRKKRMEEMEADLAYQSLKLQVARLEYEELQDLPGEEGVIQWTQSPGMLRVNNQINDTFLQDRHIAAWVKHLPIVRISPAFSLRAIERGEEEIRFGYAAPLDVAEALGLLHLPGAEVKPPARCLSVVASSRGKQILTSRVLAPLEDPIRARGLRISGDVWGITISGFFSEGEPVRHHRLYIPVEDIRAGSV